VNFLDQPGDFVGIELVRNGEQVSSVLTLLIAVVPSFIALTTKEKEGIAVGTTSHRRIAFSRC
jgi:hypothetical protein